MNQIYHSCPCGRELLFGAICWSCYLTKSVPQKPWRDPCIFGWAMVGDEPVPVDTIELRVDGITAKCSRCSLPMDDCLRVGSYISCRRCGCRMATSNPADVINLGLMEPDPVPPVVMAEPVAIDPLADVKAAWEAGRRVRFNGGSWRCLKTDGDCFGWSSPREEYEIDPEPTAPVVMAMTGAITARQLCRLWDARWNAVKCGTLTDDLRVRDVEWARFGRIVLRLTMPATKAKTDDRIEPLTNPSTSGLRAGKGSL